MKLGLEFRYSFVFFVEGGEKNDVERTMGREEGWNECFLVG